MRADCHHPLRFSPYQWETPSCAASEVTYLGEECNVLGEGYITTIDPTPIRSDNVQIVDEVAVTENPWHGDDLILAVLKPLLHPTVLSGWHESYRDDGSAALVTDDSRCDSGDEQTLCGEGANARSDHWHERFQALVRFYQKYGHAQVPNQHKDEDSSLSQWVKRQRHQHKLKKGGHHSSLTDEREELLESLGFVWDSHAFTWDERFAELCEFAALNGHCMVPTKFSENQPLAVWVKCQRRQFKLYCTGRKSNITSDRIKMLASIGFIFNPRNLK